MGTLEVDTGATAAAATRLAAVGESMRSAGERLRHTLDSLGQCWGVDDEVAEAVKASYVPAAENLLKGTGDIAATITSLSARVDQAMRTLEAAEHHADAIAAGGGIAPTAGRR